MSGVSRLGSSIMPMTVRHEGVNGRLQESPETPCCVRDEGRSLGIGLQDQVPNRRKRLGLRVPVVSVPEKAGREPVRYEPSRRTQVNH